MVCAKLLVSGGLAILSLFPSAFKQKFLKIVRKWMISARRIAAWQLPCQYFIYIHKLGQLNDDAAWLKLAKEKTEVTNFRLMGVCIMLYLSFLLWPILQAPAAIFFENRLSLATFSN